MPSKTVTSSQLKQVLFKDITLENLQTMHSLHKTVPPNQDNLLEQQCGCSAKNIPSPLNTESTEEPTPQALSKKGFNFNGTEAQPKNQENVEAKKPETKVSTVIPEKE